MTTSPPEPRMPDPLKPDAQLLVKLGSALVHAEEMASPTGHAFDAETLRVMIADADLREWLTQMSAMGLLPVKR